jgi:predicted DsbA family dithiol-disulfide isomerase
MRVEIWSDVICPWCYVGKRRFESALAVFPHRDQVEVIWRSFELEPGAPVERPGHPTDHLAAKYQVSRSDADGMVARVTGAAAREGLDLALHSIRRGNTFDAHRLLHLARTHGTAEQDALEERFLHGFFVESEPIGRREVLVRLAVDAGLPGAEVEAVLDGDRFAAEVRQDEATAAALGGSSVPFYVIDGAYAMVGAQPVEVLTALLWEAWTAALRHPAGDPGAVEPGAISASGNG